jgi:cellulose biosynthesis protein BcsQ
MRCKIFCMASAKGGAGKTVLAATFGAFLASLGKRVLLVDTDATTNGLTLLYSEEAAAAGAEARRDGRQPLGTFELATAESIPEIVPLSTGTHLIPATYGTSNTDLVAIDPYRKALARMLSQVKDSYDFVLLDAQAGSDPVAQISMSEDVSDEVILVSEYDPISAVGVDRLKALFWNELNPKRTRILINQIFPEDLDKYSEFFAMFKYLSPIPSNGEVVRAYAQRRLAINLREVNEYTFAVAQSLKSLIGDAACPELAEWIRTHESRFRALIEARFAELQQQQKALLSKQERSAARRVWLAGGLSALSTALVMGAIFWIYAKGFPIPSNGSLILACVLILGTLVFVGGRTLAEKLNVIVKDYKNGDNSLQSQIQATADELKSFDALRKANITTLVRSAGKTV